MSDYYDIPLSSGPWPLLISFRIFQNLIVTWFHKLNILISLSLSPNALYIILYVPLITRRE